MDKGGVVTLDHDWMEHRFKLFEQYTLPSVVEQTCDDFEWLVLFDRQTEACWFEKILDRSEFTPVFLGSDWLAELQLMLRTEQQRILITTRLDNDDAICPRFIEVIQKRVNLTAGDQFLNIPNGYIQRGSVLEKTHHRANPFMTFVEHGTARSVYFTPHGVAMTRHAPIVQITEERLWVQIIHERNYVND